MIKLFACDLDGTLLNRDHESDDIILDAVDCVLHADKNFAIATGRHMHANQIERLGMHDRNIYTICMNGSLILDEHQKIMYHKGVNKDVLKELLKRFPTLGFECIGMDHTYLRTSKEEHIKAFEKRSIWKKVLKRPAISEFMRDCIFDQSDEEILKHDIMKINCRVEDAGLSDELMAFVEEHSDSIINAPFDEGVFEITDKEANKGEAVARLAQHLGIQEHEVAVYGDGGNDLQMLARFSHSYATENASLAAKQAASTTIGHCNDHAVPMHIMGLLKQVHQ